MFKLPTELIELDFVKIEFYEKYMICTPNAGIILNEKHVEEIQNYASEFYGERSFGYISNRMNDYSRNISPKSYTKQFPKLAAFAVVYKSESSLNIANFEKYFIKVPFTTFEKINPAKEWMLKQIELQ